MRVLLLLLLLAAAALPPIAHGQVVSDVAGHWAEDRIMVLVRRGIAPPFSDQSFRPDEAVTRADFVRWIVGASGRTVRPPLASPFVDVPVWHPAAGHLEVALAQGWLARVPLFQPDATLARSEGVAMAVRVVGYAPEAAVLAAQSLPFDDLTGVSDPLRGAIAVAAQTEPPLLREPPRPAFRPSEPMTRAEAASLAAGVLLAVESGVTLRASASLAAGVEFHLEKRGVLRAATVWRVQIGAFAGEDNARRIAGQIRDRGLPAVVEFEDGLYKVRVGSFASAADAERMRQQLAAEGFTTWLVQSLASFEALPGPSRISSVVVDLTSGARLVPAAGDGVRMRRQRPSELALRTGALAAVNGNFFSGNDPLGCLVVEGEILSEPDPQRSCAGIGADGSVYFDLVRGELTVATGEGGGSIAGVNRERRADELVLYRPAFDESTRTNASGAEAVVTNSVVTAVIDLRGNTAIPRDGYVLSGHGRARQWILQTLRPGITVTLQTRLVAASGDARWEQTRHAIGGGPRLLNTGLYVGGEGFQPSFTDRRNPRTAIGVLPDGRVVLLVVDGRRPSHSLGMTLPELAMELRRLGAVEAMNLDGGGSSALVIGGRVVTVPSDETGERAVADALLVMPPPQSSR